MRWSLAYRLQSDLSGPPLRTSAAVLLAALVVGSLGGCLFTDPINMPPGTPTIIGPDPIYRGTSPSFTTSGVTDPDGDTVTVEWAVMKVCAPGTPIGAGCTACDQGSYLNESNWPRPEQRKVAARYDVDPSFTDQPFCVWAFAVDSKGAVRPAIPQLATPADHPPVARIGVTPHLPAGLLLINPAATAAPPYPLYSVLELSSAESSDDDSDDRGALHAEWKVTNPHGLDVALQRCPDDAVTDVPRCFTADTPGSYQVTLTVSDPYQAVDMETMALDVAVDGLPCIFDSQLTPPISSTQPFPGTFDQKLDLVVNKVEDDGDWVPDSGNEFPMFRWFIKKSGDEQFHYVGNSYRVYTVPANDYSLGDQVKVRVEFLDRNVDVIQRSLNACGDADTCDSKPSCHQRVTWTIQY